MFAICSYKRDCKFCLLLLLIKEWIRVFINKEMMVLYRNTPSNYKHILELNIKFPFHFRFEFNSATHNENHDHMSVENEGCIAISQGLVVLLFW